MRSQLQHAWATAVETVDTFTRQALKSNIGDERWKRFFALMGSVIALREQTPLVPGTPHVRRELYDEIRHYSEQLKVDPVLRGYGNAVFQFSGEEHGAAAFLMQLDPLARAINVTAFGADEMHEGGTAVCRGREATRP